MQKVKLTNIVSQKIKTTSQIKNEALFNLYKKMPAIALAKFAYDIFQPKNENIEVDYSLEETLICLKRIKSQIANDEMMNLTLRVVQKTDNTLTCPLNWEQFGVQSLEENPQVKARRIAHHITKIIEEDPFITEPNFVKKVQEFINERGYGQLISKSFELRMCLSFVEGYFKHRPEPEAQKRKSQASKFASPWAKQQN